jgi:hypothetical protein
MKENFTYGLMRRGWYPQPFTLPGMAGFMSGLRNIICLELTQARKWLWPGFAFNNLSEGLTPQWFWALKTSCFKPHLLCSAV